MELEYSSERMNSIEINGTFYSLQSPASFEKWAAATPDDFLFAIKGSKYITHQKKLKDIRIPLANFFAQGLLKLGKKVGPILWQFPAWYRFSRERLAEFLDLLPKTAAEAAELATENTIKKRTVRSLSELRVCLLDMHSSRGTRAFSVKNLSCCSVKIMRLSLLRTRPGSFHTLRT